MYNNLGDARVSTLCFIGLSIRAHRHNFVEMSGMYNRIITDPEKALLKEAISSLRKMISSQR